MIFYSTTDNFLIWVGQYSYDAFSLWDLTNWTQLWKWFDPFLLYCELLQSIYYLSIYSVHHLS